MNQTEDTRQISDGFHTFDELYRYRMLYHAMWANHTTVPIVKSWRHCDGELCFGGGWFIVVAELPTGQISNHYKEDFWDLFDVPEVDIPFKYDGHTPEEAADRMERYLDLCQKKRSSYSRVNAKQRYLDHLCGGKTYLQGLK